MAEVMHHHVEEEMVVEQLNRDIDGHKSEQEVAKNVYFDKNEGMWKCHHCIWTYKIGNSWVDHVHHKSFTHGTRGATLQWPQNLGLENVDIPKLVNAVLDSENKGTSKDEIMSDLSTPLLIPKSEENRGEQKNIIGEENLIEEGDEEVIELEFERSVEKVHTHTPYCPNCNSQITKVVLRRKIIRKDRVQLDSGPREDLVGCLSCFSIFKPSGGGSLNPFNCFGTEEKTSTTQKVGGKRSGNNTAGGGSTERTKPVKGGFWYDLFWKREESTETAQDSQGGTGGLPKPGHDHSEITPPPSFGPRGDVAIDIGHEHGHTGGGLRGVKKPTGGETSEDGAKFNRFPGADVENPHEAQTDQHEGAVLMDYGRPTSVISSSKWLDILKCIVYGGLMETIASLSIVSSAAASDVTTMNILAIGLATVISGLLILSQNLVELRNDTSGLNSNVHKDKYHELLGRRGHFLLHSSFAILSFLIFGLLPPIIYGFTFRESYNKDYKIIAVAAASLIATVVLATAKAYVRRSEKVSDYVKTITYYVMLAVSASVVAYAVGDLFEMLMDRLGWFSGQANYPVNSFINPVHGLASY